MVVVSSFDPLCDVREVDQFGYVDLNAALASGRLPASVPASEQSFDAPAGSPLSPSSIGGVPADVFDALEMRDALRSATAAASAKQETASPSEPASTE